MPTSYRFESFMLDLERLTLHGPSGQSNLRRKSFEVLRYLVEHGGRVVSKEEVMKAVWPDVTVSDESLTQCIHDIRRAIGDERQQIVKTVPRRGYLMNVPISVGDATTVHGSEAAIPARRVEALPLPDRPSVAVLPFANFSGDPQEEYLSDGITEDIITELSRFSELFVIARNSTFQYKGKATDVRHVGRELGVRYVLEGSIRREGDRVRISAQLIDAVSGTHRWAERYDRKLKDVFSLQLELARTIVTILAVHVSKAEAERTLAKPPLTWQAYDYYLRAAHFFTSYHSSFDKGDLHDARRLLQQALAIDPNYARAHAALSMGYVSSWVHRWDDDHPWPAALDRACKSAQEALRLAPGLPEAHLGLGWALTWKRQHEAAIAEFERSVALNPNHTNWRFPFALVFAGEPAKAVNVLKAHMRLDPFYEPNAPTLIGFACYMLKRYAEALPHLRESVSRAPNMRFAHSLLAATYARLGQPDNAKAAADEVLRIDPSYTIDWSPLAATFRRPEDTEHLRGGLRDAGLPQ
jgi:adenylate cyclase